MDGNIRSTLSSFKPQSAQQPAVCVAHNRIAASDSTASPSIGMPGENHPEILNEENLAYSKFSDFLQFDRINQNNHIRTREIARARLKQELRSTDNPVKSYANPANRLDQFVPDDDKGMRYLRGLGITGPLTCERIKEGAISIEQVVKNLKRLDDLFAEDLDTLAQTLLQEPVVQDMSGCGSFDAAPLLNQIQASLPEIAINNLHDEQLIARIYDGQLSVLEALKLNVDDAASVFDSESRLQLAGQYQT